MVNLSRRQVNQQNIGYVAYKLHAFHSHFGMHIHENKLKFFSPKLSQKIIMQMLADNFYVFSIAQKVFVDTVLDCLIVVKALS